MNLEQGRIIGNRYEIAEKIGVGGMANVYRAKDLKLERSVTFKVLKQEYIEDDEFIKRFSIEAQAAARLSHSNIVTVYDVGNEDNVYYIVMEYIDGYTLKELIRRKAPFANDEALGVAIQIASALENAHENGVVHRDIKPQNILVTRDGSIKVTDFGIARAANSNTITTESMGSVHYFSPEQARGVYVDNKSDIYSLGIVMYEMVTGRLPFDGESAVQLAMKHMNEPLPNMRSFNAEVSASIEKIILKSTEKVSTQRYQSAEELNNDLKRALTNETGDFVKSRDYVYDESPTVVISKSDREAINHELKNNAESAGGLDANKYYNNGYKQDEYDDFDDYGEYEADDMSYEQENAGDVTGKDYYEDEERIYKAKERKITLIAILVAVIICGGITAGGIWLLKKNQAPETSVPQFVGMSLEQATKIGMERRFYVDKTDEQYSDEYAQGIIISQSVEEGTMIKEGKSVKVVVSLGVDPDKITYKVPNFVGTKYEDAREKVESANLGIKLDYKYVYDDDVERDEVISQSVEADTEVKGGTVVTLTISRGPEMSTTFVPNCVGKTLEDAEIALKAADLVLSSIAEAESSRYDKGFVVEQVPKAGNEVSIGEKVTLVVSVGKDANDSDEEDTGSNDAFDENGDSSRTGNPEGGRGEQESNNTNSSKTNQNDSQQTGSSESANVITSKIKTIQLNPVVPDDAETVSIQLKEVGGDVVFEQNNVDVDSLPISVQVRGDRPKDYSIYVDGVEVGRTSVQF